MANLENLSLDELISTNQEVQTEPERDPELWRIAKNLASQHNISREEAYSIVLSRGSQIKAKLEVERTERIAAEKAAEAEEAVKKVQEAKDALDQIIFGQ